MTWNRLGPPAASTASTSLLPPRQARRPPSVQYASGCRAGRHATRSQTGRPDERMYLGAAFLLRQRESQSRPQRPTGSRCRGAGHDLSRIPLEGRAARRAAGRRAGPPAPSRAAASHGTPQACASCRPGEAAGPATVPPGARVGYRATVPTSTRSRAVLALVGGGKFSLPPVPPGSCAGPPTGSFLMKRESDRDAGLAQPRRQCHPARAKSPRGSRSGPSVELSSQPLPGVACAKHGPAVRLHARPGACGHRRPSRAGHLRVRPTRQDPAPARGRRRSRLGRRGAH
jgi:hypothetical protein